jgi:hypothetical protein
LPVSLVRYAFPLAWAVALPFSVALWRAMLAFRQMRH